MTCALDFLEASGRCGLQPSEADRLTPRELASWIAGRQRAEDERRIFTAAMVAALLRPHTKRPLRWYDLYRSPYHSRPSYEEDEAAALKRFMEAVARTRRAGDGR